MFKNKQKHAYVTNQRPPTQVQPKTSLTAFPYSVQFCWLCITMLHYRGHAKLLTGKKKEIIQLF